MHFCWTSSVLSSFNLVKKLPNSVIKIKCVENRLYDRKNASNFNNNKCMRGTYHRQTDETPRTIFVKIHRPVHTTTTWWKCFTKHCVVQYRHQKALVWNVKRKEKRWALFWLWKPQPRFKMIVKGVVNENFVSVTFVCLYTYLTMLTKKTKKYYRYEY